MVTIAGYNPHEKASLALASELSYIFKKRKFSKLSLKIWRKKCKKPKRKKKKKTATIKEIIRKEIKARVDNKQHCLILAGCFYMHTYFIATPNRVHPVTILF